MDECTQAWGSCCCLVLLHWCCHLPEKEKRPHAGGSWDLAKAWHHDDDGMVWLLAAAWVSPPVCNLCVVVVCLSVCAWNRRHRRLMNEKSDAAEDGRGGKPGQPNHAPRTPLAVGLRHGRSPPRPWRARLAPPAIFSHGTKTPQNVMGRLAKFEFGPFSDLPNKATGTKRLYQQKDPHRPPNHKRQCTCFVDFRFFSPPTHSVLGIFLQDPEQVLRLGVAAAPFPQQVHDLP